MGGLFFMWEKLLPTLAGAFLGFGVSAYMDVDTTTTIHPLTIIVGSLVALVLATSYKDLYRMYKVTRFRIQNRHSRRTTYEWDNYLVDMAGSAETDRQAEEWETFQRMKRFRTARWWEIHKM